MEDFEIKQYHVQIGSGSGCLFQPIIGDPAFTYVLTAKHLFDYERRDNDGKLKTVIAEDGSEFPLIRVMFVDDGWVEEIETFTLFRSQTYFPHETADVAILKIRYIEGFDKIYLRDFSKDVSDYCLYGYPRQLADNNVGNKDINYDLDRLAGVSDRSTLAQLANRNLVHKDVVGMSGGGIVKDEGDYLSIIGIQSEMKHEQWPSGQISFVPVKYLNEIVEAYADSLFPLYPPHMKDFDLLSDSAFDLDVEAVDKPKFSSAEQYLKNKSLEVANSDITPIKIREFFKEKLLVNEEERSCLPSESLWIAWLEFLTFINIRSGTPLDFSQIPELFNNTMLKHTVVEDWTSLFKNILPKSDFSGLVEGGIVVVNSQKAPKKTYALPAGRIIDIAIPYEKRGFRTDKGIDPYTSFNFVHLSYFKDKCIIEEIDRLVNMTEEELIAELKIIYNGLFA